MVYVEDAGAQVGPAPGQPRVRDGDECDVALRKVHSRAVGVVGHLGAVLASLLPARGEHEVLHR
jgi:hypothetical protein